MIRAAVTPATFLLSAAAALGAENLASANYILPGCAAVIEGKSLSTFAAGRCIGIVEGLEVGNFTNYCPSTDVTIRQRLKVVKSYIETRPEQMNKAFVVLAVQAFEAAWPCRR
jgi:hypothetical protein